MAVSPSTTLMLGTPIYELGFPDFDGTMCSSRDYQKRGKAVPSEQKPSVERNIEWMPGKEPECFRVG